MKEGRCNSAGRCRSRERFDSIEGCMPAVRGGSEGPDVKIGLRCMSAELVAVVWKKAGPGAVDGGPCCCDG